MQIASRARFVGGSAAAFAFPSPLLAKPLRARQFHNDTSGSVLDVALRTMWDGVRADTAGALAVEVFAANAGVPGGDPQALGMLESGAVQFFTLNGAIVANLVPLASFQTLPYVFRDHGEVFHAIDGQPGDALVDAYRTTTIMGFSGAVFENGFREVTTTRAPIRTVADVAGLRWRIPKSKVFQTFVESLGALPVIVNFNAMPAAIRDGAVQAQDNPLAFIANQHLERLQPYVNTTDHMWGGFNFLANRRFFTALPRRTRGIIAERLARTVANQRRAQQRYNAELPARLREGGMMFTATDTLGFRLKLKQFYRRWRDVYGDSFWRKLEVAIGHPIEAGI